MREEYLRCVFVSRDDSTIKKKVVLIFLIAHRSIVWCGILSLEN